MREEIERLYELKGDAESEAARICSPNSVKR